MVNILSGKESKKISDCCGSRLYDLLTRFIIVAFSFGFLMISILVILMSDFINIKYEEKFDYSNLLLWLIGITLLICFSVLIYLFRTRLEIMLSKLPGSVPVYLTLALFAAQVYVFYNCYFHTGWDVSVIYSNALSIAQGDYGDLNTDYYSTYPNNLFITWLFSCILKFNNAAGFYDSENAIMSIITLNAALNAFAGYLTFKIIRDLSNSFTVAYSGWLLYALFIGTSPWTIIPYSDSLALPIPILIFRLYQTSGTGWKRIAKWFLIGLFAYFGYKIKPQCLIVAIAMVILDISRIILCKKEKHELIKSAGKYAAFLLAVVVSSQIYSYAILPATHMQVDPDKEIGYTHFIMMGLNSYNNGGYNADDVAFSKSFSNTKEREKENLRVVRERIAEYGTLGLIKHTVKKCLGNYGKGTFAWGNEGHFYSQIPEDKNTRLSPLLKNIYYHNGKYYHYFSSFQQTVWLVLLTCMIGCIMLFRKKIPGRNSICILALSLIGLTLFELIFESRARYLYIYAPFYIILAVIGWITFVKSCADFIQGRLVGKVIR